MTTHYEGCYDAGPKHYECALLEVKKLQREWVGLTDEEINVIDGANWDEDHKSWGIHDFARAIQAKLKEKNCG